jgi:putative Mg2+ transporter-C (MgtC) family protein
MSFAAAMTSFSLDSDAVVRLVIAAALGAAVGIEREAGDQPAGLRTHIAVASGAALFGVISTLGFLEFQAARATTNVNIDVARVASNVVVGIGFLGAGVVFRRGNSIHNLTTAASMWAVAAIGLACGVGDIMTAVVATAILLASLVLLRPLRDGIRRRFARAPTAVQIGLARDSDVDDMLHQLDSWDGLESSDTTVEKHDGKLVIEVNVIGHPDQVRAWMSSLARSDTVETVRRR